MFRPLDSFLLRAMLKELEKEIVRREDDPGNEPGRLLDLLEQRMAIEALLRERF
jgi:hypothetical protein